MTLVTIGVGLFYIFAGCVALRAIKLGSLMDGVLEALDGTKTNQNERIKTITLTIGAYLTAASGASLVALSATAPAIFIANVLVQGGYLFWASKALPPEDEDDRRGRQQTTNAFVIYSASTAFVVWLNVTSQLRAVPEDFVSLAIELVIPLIAAFACRLSVNINFKRSGGSSSIIQSAGQLNQGSQAPTNLRFSPDWQAWPLWDADNGENISHYHIDISMELAERIEAWDHKWQETYNGDDPPASGFKDPVKLQAYIEEGKAIILELKKVWPGQIKSDERFG